MIGIVRAATMLEVPFCVNAAIPRILFKMIVIEALMTRIATPMPAISQRVRIPIRCGKAKCIVTLAPSTLSSSSHC